MTPAELRLRPGPRRLCVCVGSEAGGGAGPLRVLLGPGLSAQIHPRPLLPHFLGLLLQRLLIPSQESSIFPLLFRIPLMAHYKLSPNH